MVTRSIVVCNNIPEGFGHYTDFPEGFGHGCRCVSKIL